jgi:hypothetical protein
MIFSNSWILVTGVAIAVLIPLLRAPILDEVFAGAKKEAPWCFPTTPEDAAKRQQILNQTS